VDGIVTVVQDAFSMAFQRVGERRHGRVADSAGQAAPFLERRVAVLAGVA